MFRRLAAMTTVYPRVCGGTQCGDSDINGAGGLSPRVRGNRVGEQPVQVGQGSIPACAGEPCLRPSGLMTSWVYPRVCGGTPHRGDAQPRGAGLSPRVRGNLHAFFAEFLAGRSIPACAGEPPPGRICASRQRVYPRVCGGTRRRCGRCGCMTGLSPRVRGNRGQQQRRVTGERSIPACAGEPRRFGAPGCWRTVYPRVCGGTTAPDGAAAQTSGLSPRVRGNRVAPGRRTR